MEYLNFNGKKYLIFGASSGIGKQVALQLSQLGARLVLVGRNKNFRKLWRCLTVMGIIY